MKRTSATLVTLSLVIAALSAQRDISQVGEALRKGDWQTYSATFSSHRYSPLTEISTANVASLRPVWMYQPPGTGPLEGTPLVVNGVMYVTSGPATVVALSVKSGRPLWQWTRPIPASVLNLGFPRVNRGVAIHGETIYVGTLDGYLVALDARSGIERWVVPVADNATGHSITAAPLVVENKVIVGISGGEAGIRGFLDAYDAESGKRVWRFWTIPAAGERGSDTWPGESWKTGGGSTWLTGSYDPELRLLYWGTGNPAPDWNGESRKGDNLYTCSLVALDIDTGKMRWHFQFTPHDVHDWDANQIPVLIDRTTGGRPSARVVMANRNGFFYVLDRRSGAFLFARPYAKQTWATGVDEGGRPMLIPGMEPSEKGTLVYPSLQGATNWASPSFNPVTGLLYVPVREMGSVYFKGNVEYRPGTYFTGGSEKRLDDESWGSVRAIDVDTGDVKWDFKLPSPPWGGVLSTAGGLVFGGSNEGNFFGLDARTGHALWQFQAGGAVRSNPMSFSVDGRQHIVIAAGRAFVVFALPVAEAGRK
jgi:alcohol dehydrogenase (cytochrome c)